MDPKKQLPNDQDDRVDDLVADEPEAAHDEGLDEGDSPESPDEPSDEPNGG